ncbi:MAG: thiamine phosphate synthase, partial [Acidobacteriota bacterium]|nr:thiamine phosphate synthase [Acidobacteriota bacterium]
RLSDSRRRPARPQGLLRAHAAAALLAGGAEILQLRLKGQWTRDTFAAAEEIARWCREANARLIVNDRADFALLLDCGLHLGQDDLSPAAARGLLGSDRPIGFSTHNAAQLTAAALEPVDYIALGPIYPTLSKDNPDPIVDLDNLRMWHKLVRQPLVAIGGITRENARAVLDAGADSVAIIGDLLPDVCTEHSIRARMEEWRQLTRQ